MEKLIEASRAGAYRIDACRAAGIHYNTLLAWEKKGEAQEKGEFSEFLEALRKAEAEAVITNVEVITRVAQDGDWRAAGNDPYYLANGYGPVEHGKETVTTSTSVYPVFRDNSAALFIGTQTVAESWPVNPAAGQVSSSVVVDYIEIQF